MPYALRKWALLLQLFPPSQQGRCATGEGAHSRPQGSDGEPPSWGGGMVHSGEQQSWRQLEA